MSHVSEAANAATTLDWKLIAAAAATFLATLVIAICGWIQGSKKVQKKLEEGDLPVTSAVLLDNQTIRESTTVSREVRDRLLVHCEALNANTKILIDIAESVDEAIGELKKLRKSLSKG